MMYQTLGVLAGIALAFYAFLLLGRLGHYYADRSSWQFGRKYTLGLRLLLAIAAAISLVIFLITSAISLAVHVLSPAYRQEETYRRKRKIESVWARLQTVALPI